MAERAPTSVRVPDPGRAARARGALRQASGALRLVAWRLRNASRARRAPPRYVGFVLEGRYPDLRAPRRSFLQRRFMRPEMSLEDLAAAFRAIREEPRVEGVVLHVRGLELSWAQLESLRGLILGLRAAGKRVVAWSGVFDRAGYYAASAADRVLVQPGSWIPPLGARVERVYLGEALSRVGVSADFVPIGPYKTAADALTRSQSSEEEREMSDWLLDSFFEELVAGIAEGRGLDATAARALVDGSPYTDERGLEAGAVDGIVNEEDLPGQLDAGAHVPLVPWEAARRRLRVQKPPRPGRRVALIRIEGSIVDGRSQRPPVEPPAPVPFVLSERAGDLSVVQQARLAGADPSVAAVVVYVDSPGGSASASEAIAAALEKVDDEKPVVVAMGPIAGSGGYYVAAPARWIVAQPGTLTGSIGVIAGKLVAGELLERVGVHVEHFLRGRHMGYARPDRRFDPEERAALRARIERTYGRFVQRVASGRRLPPDAVEAVSRGRVWTGRQALGHGLIDELGSVERAFAKARELAGLPEDAPVVELGAPRVRLAPGAGGAVALVRYALDGVAAWNAAGALALCPILAARP